MALVLPAILVSLVLLGASSALDFSVSCGLQGDDIRLKMDDIGVGDRYVVFSQGAFEFDSNSTYDDSSPCSVRFKRPETNGCKEVKVDCFEFDLHDDGNPKKRRKDHVTLRPDPDRNVYYGKEGPRNVLIGSVSGRLFFKPNNDGNAGRGFACSIECVGAQSQDSCTCGRVVKRPKIVEGQEAAVHQYPWQAALVRYIEEFDFLYGPICGGTVISAEWILTAAHCVEDPFSDGTFLEDVEVVLGEHDFGSLTETEKRPLTYRAEKIIVAEGRGENPGNDDYALIKLSRAINFTEEFDRIAPACLPTTGVEDYERVAQVAINLRSCLYFLKEGQKATEWDFCVTGEPNSESDGTGACNIDTGAPLVIQRDDNFELAGVKSEEARECGPRGLSGIFADVYKKREWICEMSGVCSDACPRN